MSLTDYLPYYAAAARREGVPELWCDDAAQDIALAVWLAGDGRSIVVYRRAVSAARYYGSGRKRQRPESVELSPNLAIPDFSALSDRIVDAQRAWARLTRCQRRLLSNAIMGRSTVSHQRITYIRTKLRRLEA